MCTRLLTHAQTQNAANHSNERDEVTKLRTHVKELSTEQGQKAVFIRCPAALADADARVGGPGLKVTNTDAANAVSSRQSGQDKYVTKVFEDSCQCPVGCRG